MPEVVVRYGAVPEVSRFRISAEVENLRRGSRVVVQTHRGHQIGEVLDRVKETVSKLEDQVTESDHEHLEDEVRVATENDLQRVAQIQQHTEAEYDVWNQRIRAWDLQLELIDLERTLDEEKLILYVLGGQNAETTKLALQAAAAGFGIIEVQPVSATGLVAIASGGGCGTGGGGCGCSH